LIFVRQVISCNVYGSSIKPGLFLMTKIESRIHSRREVIKFYIENEVMKKRGNLRKGKKEKVGDLGDVTIYLSGGYRLRIFPSSSQGEYWRLFEDKIGARHFVVVGSGIEEESGSIER
jgi:hypothetical protein